MIDISVLRKNSKESIKALKDRISPEQIEKTIAADKSWRTIKQHLDDLLAQRNELSKKARADGSAREKVKKIKQELETVKKEEHEAKQQSLALLSVIPNFPQKGTPKGKSEKDNIILREVGQKPSFTFKPKEYLSLSRSNEDINLEEAAKSSGARFVYIKGTVAKLEFALLQFAIDYLSTKDFELVFPPTILKKETMQAMGYLDQAGEQEVFHLQNPLEEGSQYVLAGTAEQSLGGMLINKTYSHKELPKRYMAFTPCYRREAGSYGKDTRGIIRLHQFEKIEMFSVTRPDQSEKEHEFMLTQQEYLMKQLNIPYRVADLAAGDLGLPSSRTFDIESFLPGQNNGKGQYRETHSTSNCTDFQARRLNAKYQSSEGENKFVHTVNGTGFAMQRIIIAILENYQKTDGSFDVPKVLQKYFPK